MPTNPLEARLKRLKKLPIFPQKELIYANSPRLSKSYRGEKTWGEMASYRFHRYSGEEGGGGWEQSGDFSSSCRV